jgi:hypothetical protein
MSVAPKHLHKRHADVMFVWSYCHTKSRSLTRVTWHTSAHVPRICTFDTSSAHVAHLCTCGTPLHMWHASAHVVHLCTRGTPLHTWHTSAHVAYLCTRATNLHTCHASAHLAHPLHTSAHMAHLRTCGTPLHTWHTLCTRGTQNTQNVPAWPLLTTVQNEKHTNLQSWAQNWFTQEGQITECQEQSVQNTTWPELATFPEPWWRWRYS